MILPALMAGSALTILSFSESQCSSCQNETDTSNSDTGDLGLLLAIFIPLGFMALGLGTCLLLTCHSFNIERWLQKLHCNCCDTFCYGCLTFMLPCIRGKNVSNSELFPGQTEDTQSQQFLNFKMTGNIKNPYYKKFNNDIPYLPQRKDNQSQATDPVESVETEPVTNLNVELQSKHDDLYENDLGNQHPIEV